MIGLKRETQNDIPPPPAIQPTDSTDDLIIMRDHQHRVDDMTSLGRRQSSRKRASPHFFVPTPFRSSPRLHDHCLRHGPGRPPKRRLDAEIPASQPLQHFPGRPRRKTSDAPTNAPEVVLPPPMPPTGSERNIPERVPMSTNAPEVTFPLPMPPTGSNENIPERVWMSPPPPVHTPLLVPCDGKNDQTEANFKLNLLARLETPKHTQSRVPEKSKKVMTDEVQSVLVSHLTSGTTTSVDDMVNFANSAFSTLNWIGADYDSLYEDVRKMISYKYDLFDAERKQDMLSVSEWKKKYQEIVTGADLMEMEIKHIQEKTGKGEGEKGRFEDTNRRCKKIDSQIGTRSC